MRGAPGKHLVNQLHENIDAAHSQHGNGVLEFRWIPGQEGVRENEKEDEAKWVV